MDNKILYPELSYIINGLLFRVHNELGRYCREKEYANLFETYLKEKNIDYKREMTLDLGENINRIDFVINNSIIIVYEI